METKIIKVETIELFRDKKAVVNVVTNCLDKPMRLTNAITGEVISGEPRPKGYKTPYQKKLEKVKRKYGKM